MFILFLIHFCSCIYGSTNASGAVEHPFRRLDEDHVIQLKCASEASRTAYYPKDAKWTNSESLVNYGYKPLECWERGGVATVGWYNDRTQNLIVAHRGTSVYEPDNIFADLGIVEAAVREDVRNLSITPEHRAFTGLLTRTVQGHIADFMGDTRFSISRLSGRDRLIVDRILNFDLLYNSAVNTYQTRGGVLGAFLGGLGAIVAAVVPPVGIFALGVGAVAGGGFGNLRAQSVIDGYLSDGRVALSRTLDIMNANTVDILDRSKRRSTTPGEISLTIAGHSLGAAGALGVAARFEAADFQDLTSILFAAPGGHEGLVKIWNQNSRLPDVNPLKTTNTYHIKRSSCLVSRLGSVSATGTYTFDALPQQQGLVRHGIEEWKSLLIPSHSIDGLVADIFSVDTH